MNDNILYHALAARLARAPWPEASRSRFRRYNAKAPDKGGMNNILYQSPHHSDVAGVSRKPHTRFPRGRPALQREGPGEGGSGRRAGTMMSAAEWVKDTRERAGDLERAAELPGSRNCPPRLPQAKTEPSGGSVGRQALPQTSGVLAGGAGFTRGSRKLLSALRHGWLRAGGCIGAGPIRRTRSLDRDMALIAPATVAFGATRRGRHEIVGNFVLWSYFTGAQPTGQPCNRNTLWTNERRLARVGPSCPDIESGPGSLS